MTKGLIGSSLGSRGKQSSEVKSWKAAFVRDLVLENSDADLGAHQSPVPPELEHLAEFAPVSPANETGLTDAWRSRISDNHYKKIMAQAQKESEHRFQGRMRGRKLVSANTYSRRQA